MFLHLLHRSSSPTTYCHPVGECRKGRTLCNQVVLFVCLLRSLLYIPQLPKARQTTTQTQMETATRRFRSQRGRRRDRRENSWAATPTHVYACRESSWIAISTHVFAYPPPLPKPRYRLPPDGGSRKGRALCNQFVLIVCLLKSFFHIT